MDKIDIDKSLALASRWEAAYTITSTRPLKTMLIDAYLAGLKQGHALLGEEIDDLTGE